MIKIASFSANDGYNTGEIFLVSREEALKFNSGWKDGEDVSDDFSVVTDKEDIGEFFKKIVEYPMGQCWSEDKEIFLLAKWQLNDMSMFCENDLFRSNRNDVMTLVYDEGEGESFPVLMSRGNGMGEGYKRDVSGVMSLLVTIGAIEIHEDTAFKIEYDTPTDPEPIPADFNAMSLVLGR